MKSKRQKGRRVIKCWGKKRWWSDGSKEEVQRRQWKLESIFSCMFCLWSSLGNCEVQVIAVFPCYRAWLDAPSAFSLFQLMEPHNSGHLNLQFIAKTSQLFCTWVITPPLEFSTHLLLYTAWPKMKSVLSHFQISCRFLINSI